MIEGNRTSNLVAKTMRRNAEVTDREHYANAFRVAADEIERLQRALTEREEIMREAERIRRASAEPSENPDCDVRDETIPHAGCICRTCDQARWRIVSAERLAVPPDDVLKALKEANELCRASFQVCKRIVEQDGEVAHGVNFEALRISLERSLIMQHAVMLKHDMFGPSSTKSGSCNCGPTWGLDPHEPGCPAVETNGDQS